MQKSEELREHKGVIRFSHVSFRYPGAEADVLEDIDFTAERVRQRQSSEVRMWKIHAGQPDSKTL